MIAGIFSRDDDENEDENDSTADFIFGLP